MQKNPIQNRKKKKKTINFFSRVPKGMPQYQHITFPENV